MVTDDLAVGHTIGPWRIEGTLGRGGAATVYAGRHTDSGLPCALKVLRQPDEDLRRRMLREGRVQSALRHPHVAGVLEVLEWQDHPVLVLERVDGPDLAWLLERCVLTVPQAHRLGTGILLGVQAAHHQGLVHRDLKPANILLDTASDRLTPRVSDFGLVKAAPGTGSLGGATRSGQSFGTPGYMAPEQFDDAGRVDARVDVFSLGALLFEMLGGRPAFRGRTVFEIHFRARSGDHPPLRQVRADVPEHLEALIARCLRTDRDQRLADVDQLLAGWLETPSAPGAGGADGAGTLEGDDARALIARFRSRRTATEEHLAPPRLGAELLTEDEQVHVAGCSRCRIARVGLRRFLSDDG